MGLWNPKHSEENIDRHEFTSETLLKLCTEDVHKLEECSLTSRKKVVSTGLVVRDNFITAVRILITK